MSVLWIKDPDGIQLGDICVSDDECYEVEADYICLPNESEGTWWRRVVDDA